MTPGRTLLCIEQVARERPAVGEGVDSAEPAVDPCPESSFLDNSERQKAHENEASEKNDSHGLYHCRDEPFGKAWSATATAALSSRHFLRPRPLLLVEPLRFLRLINRGVGALPH